jgi:glycosyltransferase involved in cell wall biosynthesis
VTAVLTAHSEGVLAGPSLISFEQAIDAARMQGVSVESLVVLDRPTSATKLQFSTAGLRHRIIQTDLGDPGLARNAAVAAAVGEFVGFLDGDDLWSRNWLWRAHAFCSADPRFVVAHSEVNVIFGKVRQMWWQIDSRAPGFDPTYLRSGNYWDAMSFGSRAIYRRYPFVANDLRRGFGHEDWHWNCVTLAAGIDHRPVHGTVHFKRRRKGSQMALCDAVDAMPWINPLTSFGWSNAGQAMNNEGL